MNHNSHVDTYAPDDVIKNIYNEILKSNSKNECNNYKYGQDEQIFYLNEAYNSKKLVLVLGAGINLEHGLPDWSRLLQRLLLSTLDLDINNFKEPLDFVEIFTQVFSPSPLIAARYLRHIHTNGFENLIKKSIYSDLKEELDSELFNKIKQLCVPSRTSSRLDSIITYNYDDLLERYLSKSDIDIPFKTIFSPGVEPSDMELPIYHVHGFLPSEGDINENNRVILSEDMYHEQYRDIYNWSNFLQINKFKDNTCLFIGISFTDPNLRRLLDIAKILKGKSANKHYLFRRKYNFQMVKGNVLKLLKDNKSLDMNVENDIDSIVKNLIKIMETFQEKDASSFNVDTIWIDDYNEIPEILCDIKQGFPRLKDNWEISY